MEKPKKLTKKQRLELLEQKRAAKAYCDELAKRNEFDYRQLPAFFYSLPRGSLKTATVA